MSRNRSNQLSSAHIVLESLPDEVEATIKQRNAWLRDLQSENEGLEFIVSDVRRWTPGQRVRVAFNGGDTALHQKIADATEEITDNCNLSLDFGFDSQSGTFRTWSTLDTEYKAEIRVSFDKKGYFSLVGTDSIDPNVGLPTGNVGGRPGQCSLNLGGFTLNLPQDWRRTVRHEFLHALSFHHAHQNMRGPCEHDFRWTDDEGYVPTQDQQNAFIVDAAGRRPGIYTYLSGAPNFWNKDKVDHNLRTEEDPTAVAGPFDRKSVMLYRFPPLFYKTTPSPCAPEGEGISLSESDIRGLQLLYPHTAPEVARFRERRHEQVDILEKSMEEFEGLETTTSTGTSAFARNVAALLRRTLD